MADPRPRTFGKALGPGLLFAGAAVGVSHLVQSTRAGALFGVALIVFVLLANAMKYPAFQFGPRYAAATGRSLLEGYRRQGRWALVLYGLLTLGTMLTVQAAVTFVTAGLLENLLGLSGATWWLSLALIAGCGVLLAIGRYPLLDLAIKVIVAVLTLTTFVATVLVLSRVDWSGPWFPPTESWSPATFALVAGLIGWMPSAIDIAVWHSLWTLARRDQTGHTPSSREARLDFDIGYLGTAILAICFVLLGAAVMYGSGQPIAEGARPFAQQVVSLYTHALGPWSEPLIGTAAFGVMLSTTLTVVDGFPRALARLAQRLAGPEPEREPLNAPVYWGAMAFIAVGSLVVIGAFLSSLVALVTVATIISFLTAPILAWLNHRAMHGPEVPPEHRPARAMTIYSAVCIGLNAAFAIGYLALIDM